MENILNYEYLNLIKESAAYILCAFLMFYIGKIVYGLFHRKINVQNELVEKDNLAFAIAHTGYFIGLLLAIGSAIVGPSKGLVTDLIDISVYGLLSIILLNISTIINDKIILRRFSVYKEIVEDRNEGTGVIEAASAIGSGLIIFGAVSGESGGTMLDGIVSAIIFWFIGQIVMVLTSLVYNKICSYNVFEEVEKDNVAVGIGFAGAYWFCGNHCNF